MVRFLWSPSNQASRKSPPGKAIKSQVSRIALTGSFHSLLFCCVISRTLDSLKGLPAIGSHNTQHAWSGVCFRCHREAGLNVAEGQESSLIQSPLSWWRTGGEQK